MDNWTPIRAGLINSPKVIAMSRHLADKPVFRELVFRGTETVPAPSGPFLSDYAMRGLVVGILGIAWCWAREYGRAQDADCLLPNIDLMGVDQLANAPGFGVAMAEVGWAVETEGGVILPNFYEEFNREPEIRAKNGKPTALTGAERQRRYAAKKKAQNLNRGSDKSDETVTKTVTASDENADGAVTKTLTKNDENGGIYRGETRQDKTVHTQASRQRDVTGCVGEPPVSLETALANCQQLGVPKAGCEMWWHARNGRNWMVGSTPVGKAWQSDLRSWWLSYSQNNPEAAQAMLKEGAAKAQPPEPTKARWHAAWNAVMAPEPVPDCEWSAIAKGWRQSMTSWMNKNP